MSENWGQVAIEVAIGLLDAGTVGYLIKSGSFEGEPFDPSFGPPAFNPVNIVTSTWKNSEIDGTLIKSNDLKVLMEAGNVSPTAADKFSYSPVGGEMEIVNVQSVSPAGIPVLHILQVRG